MSIISDFEYACKAVNEDYGSLELVDHKTHIALPPAYLGNIPSAIAIILQRNLRNYSFELCGMPVAFNRKKVKLLSRMGKIIATQSCVHIDVQTEHVVFKPKLGDQLKGVVNEKQTNSVSCLMHGFFYASVSCASSRESISSRLPLPNIGDVILFKITRLEEDGFGYLAVSGDYIRTLECNVELPRIEADSGIDDDQDTLSRSLSTAEEARLPSAEFSASDSTLASYPIEDVELPDGKNGEHPDKKRKEHKEKKKIRKEKKLRKKEKKLKRKMKKEQKRSRKTDCLQQSKNLSSQIQKSATDCSAILSSGPCSTTAVQMSSLKDISDETKDTKDILERISISGLDVEVNFPKLKKQKKQKKKKDKTKKRKKRKKEKNILKMANDDQNKGLNVIESEELSIRDILETISTDLKFENEVKRNSSSNDISIKVPAAADELSVMDHQATSTSFSSQFETSNHDHLIGDTQLLGNTAEIKVASTQGGGVGDGYLIPLSLLDKLPDYAAPAMANSSANVDVDDLPSSQVTLDSLSDFSITEVKKRKKMKKGKKKKTRDHKKSKAKDMLSTKVLNPVESVNCSLDPDLFDLSLEPVADKSVIQPGNEKSSKKSKKRKLNDSLSFTLDKVNSPKRRKFSLSKSPLINITPNATPAAKEEETNEQSSWPVKVAPNESNNGNTIKSEVDFVGFSTKTKLKKKKLHKSQK